MVCCRFRSVNTRIDSLEMVVGKMDKRITAMFAVIGISIAISGIVFVGLFTMLSTILSKLG